MNAYYKNKDGTQTQITTDLLRVYNSELRGEIPAAKTDDYLPYDKPGIVASLLYETTNAPFQHGNLLNISTINPDDWKIDLNGSIGASQLALPWSYNYHDEIAGPIYYRSHGDCYINASEGNYKGHGWTDWRRIAYYDEIPSWTSTCPFEVGCGFVTAYLISGSSKDNSIEGGGIVKHTLSSGINTWAPQTSNVANGLKTMWPDTLWTIESKTFSIGAGEISSSATEKLNVTIYSVRRVG